MAWRRKTFAILQRVASAPSGNRWSQGWSEGLCDIHIFRSVLSVVLVVLVQKDVCGACSDTWRLIQSKDATVKSYKSVTKNTPRSNKPFWICLMQTCPSNLGATQKWRVFFGFFFQLDMPAAVLYRVQGMSSGGHSQARLVGKQTFHATSLLVINHLWLKRKNHFKAIVTNQQTNLLILFIGFFFSRLFFSKHSTWILIYT